MGPGRMAVTRKSNRTLSALLLAGGLSINTCDHSEVTETRPSNFEAEVSGAQDPDGRGVTASGAFDFRAES